MSFNAMVTQVLLYEVKLWEGTISLHVWDEIEKILKTFLRRQMGVKFTTSYQVMLLETNVGPIEIFVLWRVYRYITKVKNMTNIYYHICKLQKNHKSKIVSSGWVVDIKK